MLEPKDSRPQRSRFRAVVLDLDGTLVQDSQLIRPRSIEALERAVEAGYIVMIATGRSEASAVPVIREVPGQSPAVLYNGAAIYCPARQGMLEERYLERDDLERVFDYADENRLLPIVMSIGKKIALEPRNDEEVRALSGLHNLEFVSRAELPQTRAIRVSLVGNGFSSAALFERDFSEAVSDEFYLVSFPLSILPQHRDSKFQVLDVQPACAGKAEAFRILKDHYSIRPSEVVAVGDATNDLPLIEEAGLGVAMSNGMPEVLEIADRVIDDHHTDSIAELVEEIFEL